MARPRTPSAAIIIPAYNAAKTIARALDSAAASLAHCRAQGLEVDAEIVVVDDGSADSTASVVEGWQGPVRLLRQANAGAGAARNAGVRQSSGTFLFFLDADDVFYPNHIFTCLSALLADDTLGYVFTRVRIDMPMHEDWRPSLDESCPINFALRRVWHDMIRGFVEDPDFRAHGAEDTLYRACLRRLVKHRKIDVETCEQFASPGNALDRQRRKFAHSKADWQNKGIDDGFKMTLKMEEIALARFAHVAKLRGET
ncbi:MAG: glycosyltransferase family 2 protein [Rhodospirillaceae bacterium]|nr:glycosyltransferase family 2 protein [Rhodospirillaceae bacterium]